LAPGYLFRRCFDLLQIVVLGSEECSTGGWCDRQLLDSRRARSNAQPDMAEASDDLFSSVDQKLGRLQNAPQFHGADLWVSWSAQEFVDCRASDRDAVVQPSLDD
jgi:hypothetical protein